MAFGARHMAPSLFHLATHAEPGPPTQCYLGYAYACSNRPPLFSKSPVCKVNTARPFSFVYEPFSASPPPFSAKVRCVKSIRLDLFLLLRKGHFGNTHAVILKPEWGGRDAERTLIRRHSEPLRANHIIFGANCTNWRRPSGLLALDQIIHLNLYLSLIFLQYTSSITVNL